MNRNDFWFLMLLLGGPIALNGCSLLLQGHEIREMQAELRQLRLAVEQYRAEGK